MATKGQRKGDPYYGVNFSASPMPLDQIENQR
jgi:hypothetical protein